MSPNDTILEGELGDTYSYLYYNALKPWHTTDIDRAELYWYTIGRYKYPDNSFSETAAMSMVDQGLDMKSSYLNKIIKNGCNCFTAGTKVLTDDGEKNIEDIEVGDKVLAKDENNPDGELAYKVVTALYRNQRDDIIKLHVGEQIIETTDNHPFWVEGKGWVLADELQVGDKLQKADGSNLTIDKVEFVILDKPIMVYNFTVADYHTYYVTDLGVWVHNTECKMSAGNLATIGKTNNKSVGLEDVYITKDTAMDTILKFVGKGYSKGIDKKGYTTYVSKDGKYVARIGYKKGGDLELNLENSNGGNYHIKVK